MLKGGRRGGEQGEKKTEPEGRAEPRYEQGHRCEQVGVTGGQR